MAHGNIMVVIVQLRGLTVMQRPNGQKTFAKHNKPEIEGTHISSIPMMWKKQE